MSETGRSTISFTLPTERTWENSDDGEEDTHIPEQSNHTKTENITLNKTTGLQLFSDNIIKQDQNATSKNSKENQQTIADETIASGGKSSPENMDKHDDDNTEIIEKVAQSNITDNFSITNYTQSEISEQTTESKELCTNDQVPPIDLSGKRNEKENNKDGSSRKDNIKRHPSNRRVQKVGFSPRRQTIALQREKHRKEEIRRQPLEIKRQSLDITSLKDKQDDNRRQSRLPSLQSMGSNIANLLRSARQSVIHGIGLRKPDIVDNKVKLEVDRLWKIRTNLIRKESHGRENILKLKSLITDTVELLGRVRVNVREKEIYSDEDVEFHAREINSLQLLFHGILEIWLKVKDTDKIEYKNIILPEMMELATDMTSLYGEVMALFLQRFDLNIIPMLRPVHGLYYGLGLHCRYNCLDKDITYRDGASTVYSGFISGILSLLRGTKVLLKRLKFEDENGRERRRLVQSTICRFTKDIQSVLTHGLHSISLEEYRKLIHKLGNLCSDAFFTIGKTKGILGSLEMGEGVTALQPTKLLGNISHCDVVRCAVEDRPEVINGLVFQEGQQLMSDIFQVTGAPFCTSEKILLRFPLSTGALPPSSMVKVKVKYGTKWTDLNGEFKNNYIEFEAKMISAFVAVVGFRGIHREVTTAGHSFVSDDDTRVRMSIPKNSFSVPCITKFRFIQINRNRMYGYKETCKEDCHGIVACSDILNVTHDGNVDINKPILVHLPILHDIEDSNSEIVLFERNLEGSLSIRIVNDAIQCEPHGNCYTFAVSCLNNSIALGKVKRKILKKNKNKLLEEFDLYCGLEHICNIMTYMDKNLLTVGVVKLWVEIVEKRFTTRILRKRANEGLFEVPGSRSPDIRMKEQDVVRMEMDGTIQKIREIPSEHYSIVYLSTARDNYRSFHVEERRDSRGRQVGILNFISDTHGDGFLLHSATIDINRYLISLSRIPTSHSDIRPNTYGRLTFSRQSRSSRSSGRSVKSTLAYKAIFEEVPVLSHQSLLILAGAMSVETAQMLGVELGLQNEDILNLKTVNQPTVLTVFEILWMWRGKQVSKNDADQLIECLKRIESVHLANVVAKANREKRYLTRTDLK
ncbi:uncharacterized protein LOC127731152 [Mytilus californianus]|uniref:uncharacterized protein LOC127731152 n=1 Tax=Mytilus californianus TaxID=6549 RepID=UPI0022479199|nr:uncharacterized protein LOC127731152 [Mytilus californianus]